MASKTYQQRLREKCELAMALERRYEDERRERLSSLTDVDRQLFALKDRASFLAGALEEEFPEVAELLRFVMEGQ